MSNNINCCPELYPHLKPRERRAALARCIFGVAVEEFRSFVQLGVVGVILGIGFIFGFAISILYHVYILQGDQDTAIIAADIQVEPESYEPFIKLRDTFGETADGKPFRLGMTLYKIVSSSDVSSHVAKIETSYSTHSISLCSKNGVDDPTQIDIGQWYSSSNTAIDREISQIEARFAMERKETISSLESERADAIAAFEKLR